MEDFIKGIETLTNHQEKMTLQKDLNIMTTVNDLTGYQEAKYYRVASPMNFENDKYKNHNEMTFMKEISYIQPRKFYSMTEMDNFFEKLERAINRPLMSGEKRDILESITRGREYKITILTPIEDTNERTHKWEIYA